jgi:adenine deaminase
MRVGAYALAAYRMATLNAVSYYRLGHLLESATPAKLAGLLALEDLADAR